jgi:hypothetical protein
MFDFVRFLDSEVLLLLLLRTTYTNMNFLVEHSPYIFAYHAAVLIVLFFHGTPCKVFTLLYISVKIQVEICFSDINVEVYMWIALALSTSSDKHNKSTLWLL